MCPDCARERAARELQYIADDERCDKLHQSEGGLACIALAEKLLGPMRGWPEEPNATASTGYRVCPALAAPPEEKEVPRG